MLEVKNAVLGYTGRQKEKIVLKGLSFSLDRGELLCILGANGVGKTTMYRTILGFLPLLGGEILIDGKEIRSYSKEELARKIAYVPQYHTPPFPYTVFDVVLMGRGAHISKFASPGAKDEKIAYAMMERMGILYLKDEVYTQISGGERQLVLIARALTQQAKYILMDEPASNLDFGNQMRMLQVIKNLTKEGIGICFTSHYPEHAFLTDARVLALEGSERFQKGKAGEIITEKLLKNMYGLEAGIVTVRGKHGTKIQQIAVELEDVRKTDKDKNAERLEKTMSKEELFDTLMEKFKRIAEEHGLLEKEVTIQCRALTPKEAIGETQRKDFPILDGKDIMIQAKVEESIGQAFTNSPANFQGSLKEILELDPVGNSHDRSIFIAALNALMRHLGMCDRTIHCKDGGPEECACQAAEYLLTHYGKDVKIAQVGYQPALLEKLSGIFQVRVMDLNPENVGQVRYGVKVLDGVKDYQETVDWADLVLCTGSTLGNGSIVDYLDLDKEVIFYGTTAAGAAALMGWKRLCFAL